MAPTRPPPPPPWRMGFELLLLWNGQMTMGFGTVQETVILTPRTLSFSLVFFISVTAQWTRPDLKASPRRRPGKEFEIVGSNAINLLLLS